MAKYKEQIIKLLKEGVAIENVAERLGCSKAAVYRHYYAVINPHPRPKKYNEKGERRCYKCGRYLPLDQFCEDRCSSDGLQGMCRQCNAMTARQKRLEKKWGKRMIVVKAPPYIGPVEINTIIE